jgi:hypothetical protein
MKIATAKMLFVEGVLIKARATKAPMSDGYILEMYRASSPEAAEAMQNDKGKVREFKTSEAVLKTAWTIGFNEITFKR